MPDGMSQPLFSAVSLFFSVFSYGPGSQLPLGKETVFPPSWLEPAPSILFGAGGLYLFAEKVGWLWELQGWSEHHPRAAVWLRRVGLIT